MLQFLPSETVYIHPEFYVVPAGILLKKLEDLFVSGTLKASTVSLTMYRWEPLETG